MTNTNAPETSGRKANPEGSLQRLVSRFCLWWRERQIVKACGCVTYCPKCKDPLNDQAYWLDGDGEGCGTYKCRVCGNVSQWHFGIAPVAVLLYSGHARESANDQAQAQRRAET